MATYEELHSLKGNMLTAPLVKKVEVAICVKALAVSKTAQITQAQKDWAVRALQDPSQYVDLIFNAILAEYKAVPIATIIAATDAQVQPIVDSIVTTILGG